MALKHGIDIQILRRIRAREERIGGVIRPVERQRRGVGDEEVFEGDGRVEVDHAVAHAGPGQMIDPGWVRGEELRWPRRDPFREAVVGFLRGRDLPPHDEEHDVQDGDLFGERGQVREGAEDVGEEFG